MAGMATTIEVMPAGASLLDRRPSKSKSKMGVAIFLLVLLGALAYIGFHVVKDLDSVTVTSVWPYVLLALALLIALGFEFVNGFHDTANAVATVIYTQGAIRGTSHLIIAGISWDVPLIYHPLSPPSKKPQPLKLHLRALASS